MANERSSENPDLSFQTTLDSDFKCNPRVPVVGTDSRIKHLAFRSQVFFNQLRIGLIGFSLALFGQPVLPLDFFGAVLLPLVAVPL
ncbi:hypothetical protein HMPREF3156_00305, partial [Neisseria sp. HMSC06F02]